MTEKIDLQALIVDLQKKVLVNVLTETEGKELTEIDKELNDLTAKIDALKKRQKELTEKKNSAQRMVNKSLNQLANIASTLGLDPETYGFKKPVTTTTTSTATSNTDGRHFYTYKMQENGTMKPHSANNISEIAWYFTDECGGSGKDGRLTSAELKGYLTSQGIDYDKDFQVTFQNGNSIRVSYQDKE